jgi:hypothetical protein
MLADPIVVDPFGDRLRSPGSPWAKRRLGDVVAGPPYPGKEVA